MQGLFFLTQYIIQEGLMKIRPVVTVCLCPKSIQHKIYVKKTDFDT